MTQEEIVLLTKDLCARLPYYCHFKVRWGDEDYNILGVGFGRVTLVKPFMSMTSGSPLVEEVKPYLRPMSSMTEEEFEFLQEHLPYDFTRIYSGKFDLFNDIHLWNSVSIDDIAFLLDCLNRWCLDYRGLIPMGLALEAPKNMYND